MIATSAIDNVVGKVLEEAKQEILKVLEEGKLEAEEILYQAQREAELEAGKILSSRDRQVESLTRRVIGSAELEARNKSLRMVEDSMNKVFANALDKLKKNKPKHYKDSMKRMVEEALESVGSKKIVLLCNGEDKGLVEGLAKQVGKEKGFDVSVSDKELQCAGGVKAADADGSVTYDNTLEARLDRMRPVLRKAVADLFSK